MWENLLAGSRPGPRTRGLSGADGPLNAIKVGVDVKHKLQICSYGLSVGCLYRPGVTIRSSLNRPKTLQIIRKFLSKSHAGFLHPEEMWRFGPLNLLRAGKEARTHKHQRIANVWLMTLKITRKLRDHPLPSPTPDLLPFVYPTLEKRHLQSPRPSDTCLGQNPLFEKVFPRTVNPE